VERGEISSVKVEQEEQEEQEQEHGPAGETRSF